MKYGFRYTYNKLVRDKITDEIDNEKGRKCKFRILNDEEYLRELNNSFRKWCSERMNMKIG